MRNLFLSMTLLGVCCLGLAACGGAANVNTNRLANTAANAANVVANTAANVANTVANAVSSATTSGPDGFMQEAWQGGNAEVEMGKLAATRAKNPEIKKFAQMMVTDHTAAGKDLESLAKKKNITLPTDLGTMHAAILEKLRALTSEDDFDKYYVTHMVDDHEADVSAFQKQADSSSDPDVKAFAARVLPVIKKHLDAIRAIQAKMK